MWPLKPKPEKIIKELRKKEEKIQKLTKEAENLANRTYSNKNAKRLASIDDEIINLKEDMIKMGKLVLKDGKLVREESVKKEIIVEEPQPLAYIPPPEEAVRQPNPFEQQAFAQQQARAHQQELARQQQAQQQAYEAQQVIAQQQHAFAQQQAQQQAREQQVIAQQQAQQQVYEEQEEQNEEQPEEDIPVDGVSVVIKLKNAEELVYNIEVQKAQAFISNIIKCMDTNRTIQVNNKIINPNNILYVEFE